MANTPYMNLTIPTVSVTAGPEYATEINVAFDQVDAHNHTTGFGTPVPTAGISVNADFPFNNYNITTLRSSRYTTQVSPLAVGTDLACVYSAGADGDLYWNDGLGNQVRMTASGAVNVSGSGNITGMGATTATVAYNAGSTTFTFLSNTGIPAIMAVGPVAISPIASNTFAVSLTAPTLSSSYNIILPTGSPASTKIMTMSSSGTVGVAYDVDNSTIEVSSNTIQVKAQGITAAQIANNTITRTQEAAVGQQEVAASTGTITGTALVDIATTPSATYYGRPVIVAFQGKDASTSILQLVNTGGSTILVQAFFTIKRDGVAINTYVMAGVLTSGNSIEFPPCMQFIDTGAAAGAHTYTVSAKLSAASGMSFIYTNMSLITYEL